MLRFLVVGLANTAIYAVLYLAFVALSLPYLAASILGLAWAIVRDRRARGGVPR